MPVSCRQIDEIAGKLARMWPPLVVIRQPHLDGHDALPETAEDRLFQAFHQQMQQEIELQAMKRRLCTILQHPWASTALTMSQQVDLRWLVMHLVKESAIVQLIATQCSHTALIQREQSVQWWMEKPEELRQSRVLDVAGSVRERLGVYRIGGRGR